MKSEAKKLEFADYLMSVSETNLAWSLMPDALLNVISMILKSCNYYYY